MIYLDSSVLLSRVFAENRRPREEFWRGDFTASRLLEYEVMNRTFALEGGPIQITESRLLLGRVKLIDLAPHVLSRVLEPFPLPVRTLDALHLATMVFLRSEEQEVSLASYDARLRAGASALGIALVEV